MVMKISPQALYQRRRRASQAAITFFLTEPVKELLDADVVRMATTRQVWLTDATIERLGRQPAPPGGPGSAGSRTIVIVAVCALVLGAAGGGFIPELLRTHDVRDTTMMATVRNHPEALRVRVFDAAGHQVSDQQLDAAGGVREFHLSSETVVPGRVDVARDAQGYERMAAVPDLVRVTFDGTMPKGVNASRTLEFNFGYVRSPVGAALPEPARVDMKGSLALAPGDTVRLPFRDAAGRPATLVIGSGDLTENSQTERK